MFGLTFAKTLKKAADAPAPTTAALYAVQAFDSAVDLLTKIPDPDEILTKAGVTRAALVKLETDDDIYGALRTRREAVVSAAWTLEGGSDEDQAFVRTEIEPLMESIIYGAWQAVPYGYSVIEAVYRQTLENKIGLSSCMVKPLEWFDIRPSGELRYFDPATGGSDGAVMDQVYKFFVTRHDATFKRPKGEALLSRLYWPWFFRFNAWRFWAQFLERFGQPLLVGKSTDPATMAKALLAAHQDAVLGVGPNDAVNAISPSTEGGAFLNLETCIVRRYQKLILGQTLTTDTSASGGGAYALGQVHADVKNGLMRADLRLVRGTIQRIINAVCLLNGIAEVPKFRHENNDVQGLDRADRDTKLYSTGLRFTDAYYMANYGLKSTDFTVSAEAVDGGDGAKKSPIPQKAPKGEQLPQDSTGKPVAKS